MKNRDKSGGVGLFAFSLSRLLPFRRPSLSVFSLFRFPTFPFAVLLALAAASPSAFSQWQSVGTGIEYQHFTLPDPNHVFVARMERGNTNATIASTVANGTVKGARETVRDQAARYDDAINWWGQSWGQRNDAVVAINGDFFNGSSGVITGGQVQDGCYAKSFGNFGGFSGFGWTVNRAAFIGGCVYHQPSSQFVRYVATGNTQTFQGMNAARGANQLIIYTPHYDATTPAATTGVEVLVEMSQPTLLLASPNYSAGYVRQIRQNQGSTPIPFDHIVLSASDAAATTLLSNVSVGAEVRISQEIADYNEPDTSGNNGCASRTGVNWTRTYSSVGVNFRFLENGQVRSPDPAHSGYAGLLYDDPRTAVAYNATYIFFVVVDGRSTSSIGMTATDLGIFCRDYLGATDGANMDGGGSSTMVVNGVVMNTPSDGSERTVANGMMMVNVAPKLQSTTFAVNQTVTTANSTSLRLGPGTNYGALTTVAAGAQGTVIDHALKGVFAKGYYWWKASFNGTVGWVAESMLVGGIGPPTITQQPSAANVCAGSTVTFTVAASGPGTINYQWQKGQVNLTDGGHCSGATTTTLTVTGADSGDAGYYRCVVSNAGGSVSSNEVALSLAGGVGSGYIVESRAGGLNFPGYSETGTWSSSTAKSNAAGLTSTIGSRWCTIGTADATAVFHFTCCTGGTYEVFTTNCNTSNSGNPLIHKVSHAGGVATVAVCQNSTCGTNAINKWYSLGQYALNAGVEYTVTLDGSTGAGSSPSGNAGRADAIKWVLIPPVSPPTITQQPQPLSVCPGGGAAFTVAATGQGTLAYQWQKAQANLTDGGHYSGATTTTLTVSGADGNDAASYRCVVSNTGGSTPSNDASLALRASTVITQQPAALRVCAGGTAALAVTATGDGTLSYQWQKNGANLSDGGHYSGATTATLTISSANAYDVASYVCAVAAGCGTVASDAAALTLGSGAAADFDADCDVDLDDFRFFQMCFAGPNHPWPYPECTAADFNDDGDVDLMDFSTFQICFNGPNRPPGC